MLEAGSGVGKKEVQRRVVELYISPSPSHTMRFVHVPQTAFIASTLATPPNTSSSFFSETATTSSVRDSLRIEPALDSSSARGSAGENSCAATASMPLAGLSWEDMVF